MSIQSCHNLGVKIGTILCAGCVSGSLLAIPIASRSQVGARLTESARASTQSLGPLKIGMTIQQAKAAAGWQFVRIGGDDASQCQYYRPEKRLKGIAVMVTNGVISRVDITNPRIATLSGIKVGDPEQQLKSVYGSKLHIKQHKYNTQGRYLIYVPQNPQQRKYQLVFETDGRRVTNWRFGKAEEVNWVEGCS